MPLLVEIFTSNSSPSPTCIQTDIPDIADLRRPEPGGVQIAAKFHAKLSHFIQPTHHYDSSSPLPTSQVTFCFMSNFIREITG